MKLGSVLDRSKHPPTEVSDPCTIKKDETRRTMTLINLFLRLLHVFHIM